MKTAGCWLLVAALVGGAPVRAAEPLPLAKEFWQDPAFRKAFNGSYRIEARIEPVVSSEERALLVEIQKLMANGRRQAAIDTLEKSKLTEDSAALAFNLGNLYFEEGEDKAAIAQYQKAIGEYPSFRRALRNLAMALVRTGRMDEALDPLLEAIRLGDSSGTAYGMLGFCRLQRAEWASALQAYRLAQLSEPEVADWKAGVAQCLDHLGDKEEAVALLDEVIRQRPAVAAYATLQASLFLDLNRPEDAVKALELPRRLGTLDPDGLLLLADLHLRSGRIGDARARIEEAVTAADEPHTARVVSLIELSISAREWDLSRFLLEQAATDPEPRPVRRARARHLIASGDDPPTGARLLEELLAEDPTDGAALLALANHLARHDRPGRAELLYERATAVESAAPEAWVGLARLHVDQQRYRHALDAVDRALELRPGGPLEDYRDSLRKLVEAAR